MKKITLTIRQRLAIESLFGAREARTIKDLMVPFQILQKTNLSAEDKAKYFQVAGDRVFLTEEAATAPGREFELTTAEVDELEGLLKTAKLQPMDLEWALPLKKSLQGQD